MKKALDFAKKEIILIISFLLSLVSSLIVTPSSEYIGYIDYKTLALLFSLMAVTAGLSSLGVFSAAAQRLLRNIKSTRGLMLILVLLCYFSSMIITNDVALITFIPFTIITLSLAGKRNMLIYATVLETIAANLGSMLTPIGNPQNLYLFSAFNLTVADFFKVIFPYALLSLVLLVICSLLAGNDKIEISNENDAEIKKSPLIIAYTLLFAVAVLCVFRIVNYIVVLCAAVIILLAFDRGTIKKIDYSLLFTFVFLFIFIGNLKNIAPVREFLQGILVGNEVVCSVVTSQVISNVPAAILLSGFTDNVSELLVGVNLGGLGTLIASMASLISFKLVQKEGVSTVKYLSVFTVLNIGFLLINLALWAVIG